MLELVGYYVAAMNPSTFSQSNLTEAQQQATIRHQGQLASLGRYAYKGECKGCGAPWATHPLMNSQAKGANECSYCRRPR